MNKEMDLPMNGQTYSPTPRQLDRQMDRRTDGEIHAKTQTDRKTDRIYTYA